MLFCSNGVQFIRQEIGEILRYLSDQKFRLPFKLLLLIGSCPKSNGATPQQCAHNVPDFIQIGSRPAEI